MSDVPADAVVITDPLVLISRGETGKIETRIHPPFDYTHQHYGLLVCDLVRHVAAMYRVPEDKVWYWVERERRTPTTDIVERGSAFPTSACQ